jgi:DNA invertase Pin-like site-specific DNA recombinase
MKAKRAAIYLRVSTADQTTENQARELEAAAASRGWTVVQTYADEAVSGAKGRDQRPQLDAMLRDAVRRRFDVVMVWAVDRLGRSLPDLVSTMQELHGAKVDLFIHQQALDTTTPAGRAMFGMLGVFAEFERAMIQSRVTAGLDRARAAGVRLGRPKVEPEVEDAIRSRLAAGEGILKVAKGLGIGTSTVQRVRASLPCS